MSYKQIKWLILFIPTLVIALWEYVRHEFLLPYISMELGNWLSPVIVFLVTITLLRRLFQKYEDLQEELKKEREEKVLLQERERIARELHDGIAQTLFLCSVLVNRMKQKKEPNDQEWGELDKSLRQIHDYVRYSISNLKSTPSSPASNWKDRVQELVRQFRLDTGISPSLHIELEETHLTAKEKIELFACIQEALTNIRKHANATQVNISLRPLKNGWCLEVEDNGRGFSGNPFQQPQRFGLRIMQERAKEMNATLTFSRQNDKTRLVIRKGEN